MTTSRTRLVAAGVAGAAVIGATLSLAACSGDDAPASAKTSPAASVQVQRWWTNAAAKAGSAIDASAPTKVAGTLSASRADYCGMLRQTVAAGRSVLPDATATDPALRIATTAFVAELQAVAPAPVTASWRTLGDTLLALVDAGGNPAKVRGGDPQATGRAVKTIAADATSQCKVSLARK